MGLLCTARVNKEEWQAKQETMDIEAAERLHEKSNLLVTKKILGKAPEGRWGQLLHVAGRAEILLINPE